VVAGSTSTTWPSGATVVVAFVGFGFSTLIGVSVLPPSAGLVLRTRRLVLRPAGPTDVNVLMRHWSRPAVCRYLWDNQPPTRSTVEAMVQASGTQLASDGHGLWILRRHDPHEGQPIGMCSLQPVPPPSSDGDPTKLTELLYSLDPEHWGQGFATEAARAVLHFAFHDLGLARVFGGIDDPNTASRAVLERLGMRPVGPMVVHGQIYPYFAVTRDDFLGSEDHSND
jgi:RimJ/RimL family protein N-acetyltransferase